MNALDIFMYTLVGNAKAPYTSKTGGTSKGDPGGGNTDANDNDGTPKRKAITGADKAGAGILTFLFVAGIIGGVSFLVLDL